jgi:hypothetical protein
MTKWGYFSKLSGCEGSVKIKREEADIVADDLVGLLPHRREKGE